MSAVEIYFQDGYDLLNKKSKVAIAGTAGANKSGMRSVLMKASYDENGKWIPPYKGNKLVVQEEYQAKGVQEIPV